MAERLTLNLDLYKRAYLIRSAENAIVKHYPENEMKSPMHMTMGGEAISAGVCHALDKNDDVFCSYRSHGVYLANTLETDRFFGEMYGKVTGMAKGKAGSMHLSSPKTGFMGASAIVASTIPAAAGSAFSHIYRGESGVAVVFFGDGAIDEGDFWETLNFACLMKLPIIFVCEDNSYAVHSHKNRRHGYKDIKTIVSGYECEIMYSNSNDVEEVYRKAASAKFFAQKGRPVFMHLEYYRYLAHVGIKKDFRAGYRSEDEFQDWLKRDPIMFQRDKLIQFFKIPESEIVELENKIDTQVERSIQMAKEAEPPSGAVIWEDLYHG